jgi:CspA family cold shock protein
VAQEENGQAQAPQAAQKDAVEAATAGLIGKTVLEAKLMVNHRRAVACRRCGIGFVVTPSDLDSLRRWGARVIVPMLCVRCFRQKGPLPKQSGTVKWFDRRKRYGFITGEQGEDIYFHQGQLVGANGHRPREGQLARFHVRGAVKGPEALNVELFE